MNSQGFSSLVLRELLKEIEQIGEGIGLDDEDWAEAMATKYHHAIQEQPVVFLTEKEISQVRVYLARYKVSGLDLADRATHFIRSQHAAEIRMFLKSKHENQPASVEPHSTASPHDSLPSDNGAPTCFKEWSAVTKVWRLTLAMTEIPFQDAAFGTPDCVLSPLPKLWEDKLNECMQITDASAILPVPKGFGLSLTRRAFDSILPTSDVNGNLAGLLHDTVIDRWFKILLSHQNQGKPGKTVFIHSDSLDLAAAAPQEVAEKAMLVNADIELMLFPTVIKDQDHCILVAVFPQLHAVTVYDPLGPESTKVLQEKRPWIKEGCVKPGEEMWEVVWFECPQPGEEAACGVFMCINALFVSLRKDPLGNYTKEDTLFLRQYIAAVICKGELPQPL
ncbi:MAG: hypothetical protein Q9175_004606 [Cornicularia normoerica]